MKKAAILPAALGLGATGLFGLYHHIFYSPVGKQGDDLRFALPHRSEEDRLRSIALIERLNARLYERVSITSHDGLRLAGRYYHTRDGAPLAILFHGYRGTPSRDFCGGADICLTAGYNLLMIEHRAHCSSEGHTISFGVNERRDCLLWAQYAAKRFGPDVRILLVGISMGAATVLMASELPLPENVRGIIADCPYTSPKAIIKEVARRRGLPADFLWPFAELSARVYGGFSPAEGDAVEAVKHARTPILLIHGEADRFVPCEMGRAIAAANPSLVEFHTFPGAGHGISYLVDTPRYTEIVNHFCDRVLRD